MYILRKKLCEAEFINLVINCLSTRICSDNYLYPAVQIFILVRCMFSGCIDIALVEKV